jgi:hypothetical protein
VALAFSAGALFAATPAHAQESAPIERSRAPIGYRTTPNAYTRWLRQWDAEVLIGGGFATRADNFLAYPSAVLGLRAAYTPSFALYTPATIQVFADASGNLGKATFGRTSAGVGAGYHLGPVTLLGLGFGGVDGGYVFTTEDEDEDLDAPRVGGAAHLGYGLRAELRNQRNSFAFFARRHHRPGAEDRLQNVWGIVLKSEAAAASVVWETYRDLFVGGRPDAPWQLSFLVGFALDSASRFDFRPADSDDE